MNCHHLFPFRIGQALRETGLGTQSDSMLSIPAFFGGEARTSGVQPSNHFSSKHKSPSLSSKSFLEQPVHMWMRQFLNPKEPDGSPCAVLAEQVMQSESD